jgi:uncharacterized membrane protein YccC
MKWMQEIRTTLVTALVVFVAMQLLVAVIQQYIPIILIGIVVLTVGWFVYSRATRL